MDQIMREYHVNRILSDIIPFEYNNHMYYIGKPLPEFRFYAEKIYQDIYEIAKEETVLEDDIIIYLNKYNMWTEKEEESYSTIKKELEEVKISLFQNYEDEEKIYLYRQVILDLKTEFNRLSNLKSSMNHLTAEYIASAAKQKFLIGSSILKPNKKRLWSKVTDWNKTNDIIESAFHIYNTNFLFDDAIRDIAKNEPWQTIWYLSKRAISIFKKPVAELDLEQKNLCVWSMVYDNIHKAQDPPSNKIIKDDDALDGWMILQNRKKEIETGKTIISKQISNPKIKNAQEVFVVAKNRDQIKTIFEMNDFAGKIAFKSRMRQIQQDGEVTEANLHDTRQQMAMQVQNMFNK